jgi:hypothetical protein
MGLPDFSTDEIANEILPAARYATSSPDISARPQLRIAQQLYPSEVIDPPAAAKCVRFLASRRADCVILSVAAFCSPHRTVAELLTVYLIQGPFSHSMRPTLLPSGALTVFCVVLVSELFVGTTSAIEPSRLRQHAQDLRNFALENNVQAVNDDDYTCSASRPCALGRCGSV